VFSDLTSSVRIFFRHLPWWHLPCSFVGRQAAPLFVALPTYVESWKHGTGQKSGRSEYCQSFTM